MSKTRHTSGFFLVLVLAALGALLLWLPGKFIEQYNLVAGSHPAWATTYLVVVLIGAVLLLGSTGWILFRLYRRTRGKRKRRQQRAKSPSELTARQQESEVTENLAIVSELQEDKELDPDVRQQLEGLAQQVEKKRERQTLEIVAFGTISSGKSSLLNMLAGRELFATDPRGGTTLARNEVPWPGADRVQLVDTPGLGEVDDKRRHAIAREAALHADLVLLVVDGPLRNSEYELLKLLAQMEKRVIICLNKEDWYDETQRQRLLEQISSQVKGLVERPDVVSVRSRVTTRQRVRVLPDGSQEQETVEVEPDIRALADRMLQVVRHDGSDLLLANLLLQSRGLVEEARQRVRQGLDERARQLVDKYMWAAAGAAALSPLPLVDLAAGSAITSKMVFDLARVYRQDIDLDSAATLLGQLGKNLIAILGVSAATPAVAAGVASLLKTVPGAGTIAGGALQGVVQAVVTRWIGFVFIEYFRNEMQEPAGGLADLARRKWAEVTRPAELRKVIQTARKKLMQTDAEEPDDADSRSPGDQSD